MKLRLPKTSIAYRAWSAFRRRNEPDREREGPPRRRFGFLTPWKLPLDEVPTIEMTRGELAGWAREQRPLVRALGFRDSAVFHPDVINRQYIRTMEYQGRLPKGPYVTQALLGVGVGLAVGVFMLFMQSDSTGVVNYPWHVRLLTGLVMGTAVGFPMGIAFRAMMQFKAVYAPALAMAVDMAGFQWVVRTISEGPVMRLALVNRDEHVFRGSRDESGFASGRVFFRVPLDFGPVTSPTEWYDWPMLESRARGETPERYHTGKKQARATGGALRLLGTAQDLEGRDHRQRGHHHGLLHDPGGAAPVRPFDRDQLRRGPGRRRRQGGAIRSVGGWRLANVIGHYATLGGNTVWLLRWTGPRH